MVVREHIQSFKRGRGSKKSLDVGMVKNWPKIAELIDGMMLPYMVNIIHDEWEDTYFITIVHNGYDTQEEARINTTERTLWAQYERKKRESDSYKGKGSALDLDNQPIAHTSFEELNDTGDSLEEIAGNITQQVTKAFNGLKREAWNLD